MSSELSPYEPLIEPLDWGGSPLDLFRRLARGRHPFLLLSGTAPGRRAQWTVMGSDPFLTWAPQGAPGENDPFAAVGRLLAQYATAPAPGLPFAGGLVGYLVYE